MLSSNAYACISQSHPRIAAAIQLFWGHPEFVPYIDGLLVDSRSDVRQGFTREVLTSLTNLLERHHVDFPRYTPASGIWVANHKVL